MENVNESYIIRIYDQDLDDKIDYINKPELFEDLKNNGLKIIQYAHSSFGACFFFEVEGNYTGKLELTKLDTKASDFDWSV